MKHIKVFVYIIIFLEVFHMPNRVILVEGEGYHKRLQVKRKVFVKVGHKIESKCQVINREESSRIRKAGPSLKSGRSRVRVNGEVREVRVSTENRVAEIVLRERGWGGYMQS